MNKIVIELNEALSSSPSLPFLFIGSGFSRRYLNLPDWKGLISLFAEKAHPESGEFAYQFYKNKIDDGSQSIDELLPKISKEVEKDYTNRLLTYPEYEELRLQYRHEIKDDISCLKIGMSDYFKNVEIKFGTADHQDEVLVLKSIKSKVAGIITTNFDTFLEYIFDDFETYIGQSELLFRQTYEMAEIYKIHGCCSVPRSMVLTSDDYYDYNKKNAYLSAKLLTIFLEHPVIFIGYSLNDANIKNILSDIVQCLTDEQLNKLSKRLFFILRANEGRPEGVITREKEFEGRTFQVTEIIRKDFAEVYNTVGRSNPKYVPKVLRALKKDIYELVTTNDPKGRLLVLDIDDTNHIDKVDYVLGVGAKRQYGDEGYAGLSPIHLFEDLLYDNKGYNPDKIVQMTLPKLLKAHANSIPVFKYVRGMVGGLPLRVNAYVECYSTFDSHLNTSIRKRPSLTAHSISEVRSHYNLEDQIGVQKCLADVIKLKEGEINVDSLKALLIDIYELHPQIFDKEATTSQNLRSLFRKAAKIYDWMKYCEQKKIMALTE